MNSVTVKDIKDVDDILVAKAYQDYILDGQIVAAKKYYRTAVNKGTIDNYTSVDANVMNSLADMVLRLQRDVLNKTQDWALYQEMDESALVGDIAFA